MKTDNLEQIDTRRTIFRWLISVILVSSTLSSRAQITPLQAMYFQNRYQYNPAMAGMENALLLNLGYRQQSSSFPGAAKTALFTADMKAAKNVGIGLNVSNDQEGLIGQTRVMGTYAYHLPLNAEDSKLSFGLSLGVNDSRIDFGKINGDPSDDQVAQYNQLKPTVDGDFGLAYTSKKLTISSALPNLKAGFFNTSDNRFDGDRLLFITTVSYKIGAQTPNNMLTVEPLISFRKIKGYQDIFDAGFNLTTNYGLFFQGIYHTNESLGLGLGFNQDSYLINISYNMETGEISKYINGSFEFGLKLRLFNNK